MTFAPDSAFIAADLEPAAMLRAAGLRVTDSRQAVLAALAHKPHSGADAVVAKVSEFLPNTSRQAVYNVLGDLVTAGIARRIEPAGMPGLYELRVGDNHHHAVCTSCGTVTDINCAVGHAPCLTPDDGKGFAIAEAEVTFWGLCGACQRAPGEVSRPSNPSPKEHTHD